MVLLFDLAITSELADESELDRESKLSASDWADVQEMLLDGVGDGTERVADLLSPTLSAFVYCGS